MNNFFANIKKSVYDPLFYQEILTRPFGFSMRYFVELALALALVLTIATSVALVPTVNSFVRALPTMLAETYPDELELNVKSGILTSNVAEPYLVPVPEKIRREIPKMDAQALVVIDTANEVTISRFNEYHAAVWLARDAFVIADSNGSIKIQPYGSDVNAGLTKEKFLSFVNQTKPYLMWAAPLMVIVVFIAMTFVVLLNLIYLLIAALLILALGRFTLRERWTYGTAYRIGLHALTLPVLLDALLMTVGQSLGKVPFFATVLMLIVVYVNYKKAKPASAETASAGTPGSSSGEPPTPPSP